MSMPYLPLPMGPLAGEARVSLSCVALRSKVAR